MNNELDFNYSDCIKEYSTFKETTYVNICTNETTEIPMSITGYFVIGLLISCIILLLCMGISMIKMSFEKY